MTNRWFVRVIIGLLLATALIVYAGCGAPSPGPSPSPTAEAVTLTAKAEAEAKAILEAAEATAIVRRARETAQALTQGQGAAPTATPVEAASSSPSGPTAPDATATPVPGAVTATPARALTATATKSAATAVTVEKVTFVADGGLVMVSYRAPEAAAQRYWQGAVYMVDEATGAKFDNVATMPVIGPLIQRPKKDGQAGYIIFHNRSVEGTALKAGDFVAVVLNNYKQEHVVVSEN